MGGGFVVGCDYIITGMSKVARNLGLNGTSVEFSSSPCGLEIELIDCTGATGS